MPKRKFPEDEVPISRRPEWNPRGIRFPPDLRQKIEGMGKRERRNFSEQVLYLIDIALRKMDRERLDSAAKKGDSKDG